MMALIVLVDCIVGSVATSKLSRYHSFRSCRSRIAPPVGETKTDVLLPKSYCCSRPGMFCTTVVHVEENSTTRLCHVRDRHDVDVADVSMNNIRLGDDGSQRTFEVFADF